MYRYIQTKNPMDLSTVGRNSCTTLLSIKTLRKIMTFSNIHWRPGRRRDNGIEGMEGSEGHGDLVFRQPGFWGAKDLFGRGFKSYVILRRFVR